MKKLGIAISLLLVCSVAGAQSLASVAKKERKRRADNRKAGVKSVTIVQTFNGVPGPAEANPAASNTTDSDKAAAKKGTSSKQDRKERAAADPWDAIYSNYLARYRKAANDIDQLKAEQRRVCNDSGSSSVTVIAPTKGGTVLNVPTEQQNRCASIPGRLVRLELELKQIERDCAEDARRRGVVPGRARLYR